MQNKDCKVSKKLKSTGEKQSKSTFGEIQDFDAMLLYGSNTTFQYGKTLKKTHTVY